MSSSAARARKRPPQKADADSQILPIAAELPWEDDDGIHAVLFQGHRLLQPKQGSLFRHDKYDEIRKTVELHFSGTAQDIYSDFSVVCTEFDDLQEVSEPATASPAPTLAAMCPQETV